MFVLKRLVPLALLGAIALNPVLTAEIRETQETLINWVETQKAIAETKAEWISEKEIVNDLIRLLENEKEKLNARLDKLEDSDNATDKVRTKLNADRERLVAANDALATVIPDLEQKTRDLLVKMPEPLIEELDPLIRRLPNPQKETRLPVSQRLLTVVGILNKIDKFNTGITIKSEIRNVGESNSEVTTLYFGLAGAFFANDNGSYAGTGAPGETGWEWTEVPAESKAIVTLINSYEGAREAKFVSLPISVR